MSANTSSSGDQHAAPGVATRSSFRNGEKRFECERAHLVREGSVSHLALDILEHADRSTSF